MTDKYNLIKDLLFKMNELRKEFICIKYYDYSVLEDREIYFVFYYNLTNDRDFRHDKRLVKNCLKDFCDYDFELLDD